jgi:hypothetical protein
MPGWQDIINLILGSPTQAGPPNPTMTPAPQARQGGLLGQGGPLGGPGSLMQAIGIPMAIMGAVEAARGKPVGAAYLEGVGGLLGEMGSQRGQAATQTNTAETLKKEMAQRFPQFANDKGLQESVESVIKNDPSAGLANIEALTKHFESLKKPKESIPGMMNVASMMANGGKEFDQLTTDAERQKAGAMYQKLQTDPKFAMEAKRFQDAILLQNNAEANRMQTLLQSENAAANRQLNAIGAMGARQDKTIAAENARQDKAIKAANDRLEKLLAAKGEKDPKGDTVKGYDNAWDEGDGLFLYSPSAATTEGISTALVGGVLKATGYGNKPFYKKKGESKRYYLTETKTLKDGRVIHGATIPGKGFVSPE